MMKLSTLFVSFAAVAVLVPVVSAQADSPPPGPPRSPPPEAFTACSGAKEGDSCTVSIHGHDIPGTCASFADRGLACRPDAPPPPPPEALAACATSKEGDACTMTFDGHSMQGTCASLPGGQALACRPAGPPPPPP